MSTFLDAFFSSFLFAIIDWASGTAVSSYSSDYNWFLIILSYLISVLGSYASLLLVERAWTISTLTSRIPWLLAAAITMGGCAVWAMHFVGMLAFHPHTDIEYELSMTLFSLLLAIIVTGLGLMIVGLGGLLTWPKLLLTSFFVGLGFALMHYTGMAAMLIDADIQYRPSLFILSILIAITASFGAFWLCLKAKSKRQKYAGSLMMGGAISGMHYTGMAAAVYIANPALSYRDLMESAILVKADLVLYIFIWIVFTLSLILFLSLTGQAKVK